MLTRDSEQPGERGGMTNSQEDGSGPACCWYVAVVHDGQPTGTQLKDMRKGSFKGGPVRPG